MRGLHLGDVNLYDRVLQVRAAHAKNKSRARTVPLSADAFWALDRIYQRARGLGSVGPQDYLLPLRIARGVWDPRQCMTESGIKRPFDEIRKQADVPWLRIHDLRHCGITRMAEAGVPVATIMSIAGHMSPRMTQHYTHISDQAKKQAIVQAFDSSRAKIAPKGTSQRDRRRGVDRRRRYRPAAAQG